MAMFKFYVVIIAVQLPSHVWIFETPLTAARQASLTLPISLTLPKFMFIALVMPSSHLFLSLLLLLLSVFPSIRDFSNESAVRIRWPKYWRFRISSSSEYSGLISLKIDQFDLLVVQGAFRVFSSSTIRRHQLLGVLAFSRSSSHNCTWPLGRPYSWLYGPLLAE